MAKPAPALTPAQLACHIIDALKASLKRLQLDHVDLYQVHGFDPATPIEETVRALDILCSTVTSAMSAPPTGRPGKS